VAAEAMARAFADWDSIQHLAHRDAWVLRVTTDLAFDASRRRPHFPRLKAARKAREATALGAALRSLPRRQREVVALRHAAALTDEEIARALEIPPATVVARMDRGMAVLRKPARDSGDGP
jgi:DNA-directed RNA polymerase specialized sigma24 family protein